MSSWFKKVFSSGDGEAAPAADAELSAPATPPPAPTPQPPMPGPIGADGSDFKIRKIVNAPIVVPEEEQSSWSEDIRIKAQVDGDGYQCKFMVDRPLFEGLSAWFPGKKWTSGASPLAERLFDVDGVGTVLLHGTTVTLGRAEGNNRGWEDLATEAGAVIREHLKSESPTVTDAFRGGIPEESETRDKIQTVLDLEINPGIAAHSGVVSLERVEGNTLYITMGGGCQGCAASTITLRHGIHTAFRRAVPEVGAIYDETDHTAGDNPFFKELPAGMAP